MVYGRGGKRKRCYLTTCCCCVDLKKGSIAIAIVFVVTTGLILIALGMALHCASKGLNGSINETPYWLRSMTVSLMDRHATGDDFSELSLSKAQQTEKAMKVTKDIFIASIVVLSCYLLTCISLIMGILKENVGLIVPWIIFEYIRWFIIILPFTWFIILLMRETGKNVALLGAVIPVYLIIHGASIYSWIVVVSTLRDFLIHRRQVSSDGIVKDDDHENGV